jgi:hypothetical protein
MVPDLDAGQMSRTSRSPCPTPCHGTTNGRIGSLMCGLLIGVKLKTDKLRIVFPVASHIARRHATGQGG